MPGSLLVALGSEPGLQGLRLKGLGFGEFVPKAFSLGGLGIKC